MDALVRELTEEKEMLQRNALFKTICKCNGKVCTVMENFGSLDNMVSQEMVDKFHLARIPHETPYYVSWLNNEHSLLVKE